MNLRFEPTSIRLHVQTMEVLGGEPRLLETRPAELEGVFVGEQGGIRGNVTVPLDEAESQFIREVIRSAAQRAMGLIRQGVAA